MTNDDVWRLRAIANNTIICARAGLADSTLRPGVHNLMRDDIHLAQHVLRTLPRDDHYTLWSTGWMLSVGFEPGQKYESTAPDYELVHKTPGGLWLAVWCGKGDIPGTAYLRSGRQIFMVLASHVMTRGDVREICRVLGIQLQEGHHGSQAGTAAPPEAQAQEAEGSAG